MVVRGHDATALTAIQNRPSGYGISSDVAT